MNLDDEVAHVTTLVTRRGQRRSPHVVWRGWHFYENRERAARVQAHGVPIATLMVCETGVGFTVSYRKQNRRFDLVRWVRGCVLYLPQHAPGLAHPPKLYTSFDDIPWEIHHVYPLDAYLAALESYRASV